MLQNLYNLASRSKNVISSSTGFLSYSSLSAQSSSQLSTISITSCTITISSSPSFCGKIKTNEMLNYSDIPIMCDLISINRACFMIKFSFSLFSIINQSACSSLDWVLKNQTTFEWAFVYASLGISSSLEENSYVNTRCSRVNSLNTGLAFLGSH